MKKSDISPFEVAYYVENYCRSKHEDNVERGPSRHVVSNNWHGLQEWMNDPSRRDFPDVDTQHRKTPPKDFNKKIPQIKHMLHKDFAGIFQDTYWQSHKHKRENDY